MNLRKEENAAIELDLNEDEWDDKESFVDTEGFVINSMADRSRFIKALRNAKTTLENSAMCYCYGSDEDYLRIINVLNKEIQNQKKKKDAEQVVLYKENKSESF